MKTGHSAASTSENDRSNRDDRASPSRTAAHQSYDQIRVSLELLDDDPDQPRQYLDLEYIEELAETILEHGLIHRIAVRRAASFDGDHIHIDLALPRKLVGLRYEGGLRWRIYFFDVDLGTVEIVSLNGVVSTAGVSSVNLGELGGIAGVNPQEGAAEGAAVAHEPEQKCQRCLELFPASKSTEVIMKVVRKVVSKAVRRLIRKVISTCMSLRTTLLTSHLMTLDHGSSWFCREELATPPPANEARSRARLAPTPPSQRLDGGVGASQ